jgi:uncharacterized membrane protein
MTLYEFLLFVHVLAAAAWYGAALLILMLVSLMSRARDREGVLRLGHYEDLLANLLFIPSSLVALGVGVWLVLEGPWSFGGDGWVAAGLGIWVAIFILGIGVIVPAGKKLKRLGESDAPEAELDAQIRVVRNLSWIDVVLLTAAIFIMTVKPF